MRARHFRKRGFRFEGLENRSMLAGDVTVDFIANSLVVTGDGAANAVLVGDTGNAIVITGIQGGTSGSTSIVSNTGVSIAGNVATISKAVLDGDIYINLLNGRDELSIDGINLVAGTTIPSKLKVNMGEGNDTLTMGATARNILASDVTLDLDEGEDNLTIDRVEVRSLNEGNLFIMGGFGVDTIRIGANDTNVIEGDLVIDTGTGNDIVAVDRTNIFADFAIDTSGGNDTVDVGRQNLTSFQDSVVQVRGNMIVDTGQTDDTVRLDAVLVVQNLLVTTGDGNDTVILGDDPITPPGVNDQVGPSATGDIVIATGLGNDDVAINLTTGANAALINLGQGLANDNNELVLRNSSFSNDVAILGGVNVDSIDIDALNIVTNLYIATGGGNDSIDLQGTLVTQGLLTINSGAGDDNIRVDNSIISRIVTYAEAGINDVELTANLVDDFFLDLGQEGGSANLTGVVQLRGFARGAPGAAGTGNLFGSILFEGFTVQ
jgi:hypothetical protein